MIICLWGDGYGENDAGSRSAAGICNISNIIELSANGIAFNPLISKVGVFCVKVTEYVAVLSADMVTVPFEVENPLFLTDILATPTEMLLRVRGILPTDVSFRNTSDPSGDPDTVKAPVGVALDEEFTPESPGFCPLFPFPEFPITALGVCPLLLEVVDLFVGVMHPAKVIRG